MYQWYTDARICYVYLVDVGRNGDLSAVKTQISESRWFGRGWTLQELLAPRAVSFYSHRWSHLGTRNNLIDIISSTTRIEERFLAADAKALEQASISKKMSWASRRRTSRIEDEAYCLLGLFGVHMPLLYGEGKKAFRRLQEEILKENPADHTIFAWGTLIERKKWSRRKPDDNDNVEGSSMPVLWDKGKAEEHLCGLLAESPSDFEFSGDFTPWFKTNRFYRDNAMSHAYPVTVGKAIRLQIPVNLLGTSKSLYHRKQPATLQVRHMKHMLVMCGLESSQGPALHIPIQQWGDASWGRTRELFLYETPLRRPELFSMMETLYIEPERKVPLESGDIVIKETRYPKGYRSRMKYCSPGVHDISFENVIRQMSWDPDMKALFTMFFQFTKLERGLAVCIDRLSPTEGAPRSSGSITLSLLPVHFLKGDDTSETLNIDDMVWYHADANLKRTKPLRNKRMAIPVDTLDVDIPNLPLVRAVVERMPIDSYGGSADVITVEVSHKLTERPEAKKKARA
jgi:hypothetical protein